MIVSTRGKFVEEVAAGRTPKGFPADLVRGAERRLRALNNAVVLNDLRLPRGNGLEALKADRAGQHSIRINDQWRICFRWTEAGAEDVEITDDHEAVLNADPAPRLEGVDRWPSVSLVRFTPVNFFVRNISLLST